MSQPHPDVEQAALVLQRTPAVLHALLDGLPDAWVRANEGPDTWSAFDVVGHLIHGEETDWIPRAEIILRDGESRAFKPFDRHAMLERSKKKSLRDLLDAFASLRAANVARLLAMDLGAEQLALRGRHPALGTVTLAELLNTWVVHDLGHVAQIARVLARQRGDAVGPWKAFLPVLAR